MKKLLYILFFLICNSLYSNAQDLTITIGRGTECFGRGACSIQTSQEFQGNATLIENQDGQTLLRIFREHLTRDEENRILTQPIASTNQHNFTFKLEEHLKFSEEIVQLISKNNLNLPKELAPKEYPTFISSPYIDIVLANAKK